MTTCLNLPEFPNATITTDLLPPFELGTDFFVQCNLGYVHEGDIHTTRCEAYGDQGHWSNVSCVRRSCGDPGLVANADRVGDSFLLGDQITFKCKEGYRTKDLALGVRSCFHTGQWYPPFGMPVCDPIICKDLAYPDNGNITFDRNSAAHERGVGSLAIYACDENYKLHGSNRRKCLADGTWDGEAPACERTICPDASVEFGEFFGPAQSLYRSGDVRNVQCYDDSLVQQKCQIDGSWLWLANPCPPVPKPGPNGIGEVERMDEDEDEDEEEDDEEVEDDQQDNVSAEDVSRKQGMEDEKMDDPVGMNEDHLNGPDDVRMEENNLNPPDDSTKLVNPDTGSPPAVLGPAAPGSPSVGDGSRVSQPGTHGSQAGVGPLGAPGSSLGEPGSQISQSESQPPTSTSADVPTDPLPPTTTSTTSVPGSQIPTTTSTTSVPGSQIPTTTSTTSAPGSQIPTTTSAVLPTDPTHPISQNSTNTARTSNVISHRRKVAPSSPTTPPLTSSSGVIFTSMSKMFPWGNMTSMAIVVFSFLLIIITVFFIL